MKKTPTVSTLLARLQKKAAKPRVSLDDVLNVFGRRSTAPLLFIFGVLLVSPLGGVPGVAPVFGTLIALLTIQSMFCDSPWVPKFVRKRTVKGSKLRKSLARILPWVKKMERYCQPRIQWLTEPPCTVLCDMLLVTIGLAIPFLGLVPGGLILPGIAVAVISIARFHHDGVWLLVGTAFSAAAFWSLTYAASENIF